MPKLIRKSVILAKIESTAGTDPTPTGSSNAILVRNLSITPLAGNTVSRDLVRPYLGEFDQIFAEKHVEIEFEVEYAASGTAGTAPAYGPLLKACAMSETISAGVSVTYAPVSTGFSSVTIYMNVDGLLHKITYARGTVDIELTANQIPVFKFKFIGVYNAVTDTAAPTPTYTGFQTPFIVDNTNTTGFSFFSVTSLVLESLMVSIGNQVEYRSLIGSTSTEIVDRRTSGEVVFEMPPVSTLDIFGSAIANTTGAISIAHGVGAGKILTLASTKVDIGQPSYQDSQGIQMVRTPFVMLPTSGNDEWSLVLT